jgi:predicted dehydrogenase
MRFPTPTPLPSTNTTVLKWGIAAPGDIASTFTAAVNTYGSQNISGVASRSVERAQAFAKEHSVEHVFGSYDELFASDAIDAVYIANHIDGHLDLADAALDAGKHVLVEKPLHYSSTRAQTTLARAREKGLFMTEAMWTRYLPQSSVISQIIASEEFGRPEHMIASFAVDNRGIQRLWERGTGGISYDMGIYPIALAYSVFGKPSAITALGRCTPEGLDEGSLVRLEYPSGAVATLMISGVASLPCQATISGENMALTLDHPFFVPTSLRLSDKELYQTETTWADGSDVKGHSGLYYQTEWFAHFVTQGLTESPLHTHEEIVTNLEVAEEICRQLGSSPWL